MTILRSAGEYLNDNPILFLYGFIVYLILFMISITFSKPKPGKNPFTGDTRKPIAPFVSDRTQRDKIIKQGFTQKRIPEKIDVIVIGSGLGGMTTAAILAKSGKKVLVLEQHDQAGGCCHSFVEKGYEFDAGIHYVGEMEGRTMTRTLFEQLTDGQVEWSSLDSVFDTVAIGKPGEDLKTFDLRLGKNEFKQGLLDSFPNDHAALEQFFKDLKECRGLFLYWVMLKALPMWVVKWILRLRVLDIFTNYRKFTTVTTDEYLAKLTQNKELRAVIAYSFGDYGTSPHKSCFLMQSLLLNHFMYSASYPVGGASQIAFNMIPVIEKTGGRVFVRANVTEILFEKGKACGVKVLKGNETIDIHAKLVISGAGLLNTLEMLPPDVAKKSSVYDLVQSEKVEHGVAALSLFVGLKGSNEDLGLKASNVWAFTDADLSKSFQKYYAHTPDVNNPVDVPLLFIGFPSAKDPSIAERTPDKSTCAVITLANWDWFKQWEMERVKRRGDDYEAIKDSIAQQMWKQTLAFFPQLADKVEYLELGSPLSNKYYIRAGKGEIYGLDHNMDRFNPQVASVLRPSINIPCLYLTGQDILGCGFSGALWSGLITASAILHRNVMTDLTILHKQVKKEELSSRKSN